MFIVFMLAHNEAGSTEKTPTGTEKRVLCL